MESAGNGGFNYYRRPAQTSSGMQLPAEMVMMRLPAIDNSGINNSNRHHYHVINSDVDNECTVREQDRFMPIANVIRIMRRILPPHAKISDDAKETIQECVSEFIGFITGEANERCQEEQRKTITAEDVLWAMSKLGFDDYMEPLTFYLNRYREFEGDTRGSIRGEPLVMRRPVDVTAMGVPVPATFGPPPPPFHHMGHHHNLVHHQQHGFVGVPAVGGFMRDGSSPGSSQGGLGAIEPYEQGKQLNNSRSI